MTKKDRIKLNKINAAMITINELLKVDKYVDFFKKVKQVIEKI